MNENSELNPIENNQVEGDNNALSNDNQINVSDTVENANQSSEELVPTKELMHDDVMVLEEIETVDAVQETEAVNSFEQPEVVNTVEETELVNDVVETEPISSTEENEVINTVEETETVSSFEQPEVVKTVEETEVVNNVVETEAIGSIEENEVINTVEETETVSSFEQPEVVNSVEETEAITPVEEPEVVNTYEEPINNTVEETEVVNVVEETTPEVAVEAPEVIAAIEETPVENIILEPETVIPVGEIDAKKEAEVEELMQEHELSEEEEHEPIHDVNYSTLSKIELIEKLEELVKNSQISKIKFHVTAIKVAYFAITKDEKQTHLATYLENGGTKEEYIPETDPLEERFKAAFDIYRENKIRDDQEQEKIKLQNLEAKKQILEEIKQLIASDESLKKTYDDFKILQDKWKQVGMVPRGDMEELWNNYHFQVEKFFEKVKINKELKDLDLKKNLEAKILICEKAEELLLGKSITKTFKLLQKYHDEWKEIGPVILDKKDEIWERFKNVSDNINDQRRAYYESLHAEQENNLLAKTALCEKAEELLAEEITSINDWRVKTDLVLEMQKIWDTIGRAPIKSNDEIWERFRNTINTFFKNKKTFFTELKDNQLHNYNLKLDLCAQAEGLLNSTNFKEATAEIIKLQQEWKNIGQVYSKNSDKVWKRFRTACDTFFSKKQEYFSSVRGAEKDNQKKKEDILERVNNYEVSGDKKENLENLKNFQREWVEIGFVPMNVKEKLQNDFKIAIKSLMDKMKISSNEFSTANYRTHVDNIQNSSDSRNGMQRENLSLEGKVSKLKAEILQWENNLGFFASSKKADLLKEEFERKIQAAKQEVALLEAKIKMIRSNPPA